MLKNSKNLSVCRSTALSFWLNGYSNNSHSHQCISAYRSGKVLFSIAKQVCDIVEEEEEEYDNQQEVENTISTLRLVLKRLEKSFNQKFSFIDLDAASKAEPITTASLSLSSSLVQQDDGIDINKKIDEQKGNLLHLVQLSQILLACAVQNEQHKQTHIETILAADEDIQTELMTMIEEVLEEIGIENIIDEEKEEISNESTLSNMIPETTFSITNDASNTSLTKSRLSPSARLLLSPEQRLNSISASLSWSSVKAKATTTAFEESTPLSSSSSSSSFPNVVTSKGKRARVSALLSPLRPIISQSMTISERITPAAKTFRASTQAVDINQGGGGEGEDDDSNCSCHTAMIREALPSVPYLVVETVQALPSYSSSSSTLISSTSTLSTLSAVQEENQLLRIQLEHLQRRIAAAEAKENHLSLDVRNIAGIRRIDRDSATLVSAPEDILGFLKENEEGTCSSLLNGIASSNELELTQAKLAAAEAQIASLIKANNSTNSINENSNSSSSSNSSSNSNASITESLTKLREECDVLRPAVSRAEKAEALVEKLKKRLEALSDVKECLTKSEAHAADLTSRLLIAEKEAAKVSPLRLALEEAREKVCVAEVRCSELNSLLAEAQDARDALQNAFDNNVSGMLGFTKNSSNGSLETDNISSSSTDSKIKTEGDNEGVDAARALIAASGGLNWLLVNSQASANSTVETTNGQGLLNTEQAERLARLEDERADILASRSTETADRIAKLENDLSDLRRIKVAFEMRLSSALSKVSECERIIKTSEVREGEKDERISKLERELQTALASIADFKSRLEASLIAERDVSQTLEEERTSRAAEKSLSTRRHAALSSELSAAHADHSLAIDAMKRDAETRALQLSSSLDTLRSQLKAANEDAVLREESLKTTLERTSKTELESLKRQHACEVAELNTRCKEFEGTATNLSATLSSLEIQKEKGLAYVSSLQATLRAREHDLQALREEAEEELAAMDAQITASRADAEAALSRLTLIESRLVEARREADMHRSKAERLARSLSSEQGVGIEGGGGTGGTLLGGFIEGEYGHVTLEAIDSKLKLLASEIETLGKERERLGTLLESIVRFIISRGLQLPKSLLTEFEELGNDTRLDNNKDEENEEEEEEVTSSSSSSSSSLEYDDQELLSTVTSTTGVSRGGKAQRVKVRDDESKSTRTRRNTRATTRKKNVSRTEMTHADNEDEEEKEEIEDSLSGAESARHASQSLLALAEMRNLIAARDTELASLRRKDAESSYLRLSLERQSQKLTDTVSELEAKLTRASLLHQRLMKALADADIQVLGSDTSFSIIQENEGGGEGEGGVFDLENNRQAFGIGKLHSGSDNNEDEFVPACTVFSSSSSSLIFAPAPRRKEAAE